MDSSELLRRLESFFEDNPEASIIRVSVEIKKKDIWTELNIYNRDEEEK